MNPCDLKPAFPNFEPDVGSVPWKADASANWSNSPDVPKRDRMRPEMPGTKLEQTCAPSGGRQEVGSLERPTGCSSSAGAIAGRVRMRHWLLMQVKSGVYSGLKWVDDERTMLRIPWKHGSSSGWSPEDGKLFESWAVHSGKFDHRRPNARKFKANFRCALRSLSDVEEIKQLSRKTGKDAYKIFKFMPEKRKKRQHMAEFYQWSNLQQTKQLGAGDGLSNNARQTTSLPGRDFHCGNLVASSAGRVFMPDNKLHSSSVIPQPEVMPQAPWRCGKDDDEAGRNAPYNCYAGFQRGPPFRRGDVLQSSEGAYERHMWPPEADWPVTLNAGAPDVACYGDLQLHDLPEMATTVQFPNPEWQNSDEYLVDESEPTYEENNNLPWPSANSEHLVEVFQQLQQLLSKAKALESSSIHCSDEADCRPDYRPLADNTWRTMIDCFRMDSNGLGSMENQPQTTFA